MSLRLAILMLAAGSLAAEPFSHKRHVAMKLQCTACHATAASAAQAGFPSLAKCQTCHPDMASLPARSPRVYRVKDFVFFHHQRHSEAKVACATCHGDVYATDVLKLERPVTMVACVACHKEHKASIACNLCHELGQ